NAIVLESACRHVRREHNFPPSIAEMLKAIKNAQSAWCDRWETLDWNIDDSRQMLEKLVAEAEAQIAEGEAKLAEREAKLAEREAKEKAKEKAAEERRRLYREAYERMPANERRAFEEGQRHRRFHEEHRPEIPAEYGDEDHLSEFNAYYAGLAGEEIPGLELK